jgi:hypothetical protein
MVFEDREIAGRWSVEKFDDDGWSAVATFTGADARERAISYAKARYATFIEKRLEPYPRR